MTIETGKYYWLLERGEDWVPAQRVQSEQCMGVDYCWKIVGHDNEIYDNAVDEVGPEIIAPVPRLVVDGPPFFADDQPCGYCNRPIGSKHENWCRQ